MLVTLTLALSAIPAVGAPTASSEVLALYQTPGLITPDGALTLSMQLASPASVQQVYFTFCQLTSALCYLPVPMTPSSAHPDWFVGTTRPMSAYPGMVAGVSAGYNITIVFNDNSTLALPALPNAFANLTLNQTVTGENVYQITVENMTFGVAGRVVDSVSGLGVPGASVTLSPGTSNSAVTNATGVFTLRAVQNGSYSLTVSKAGYASYTVPFSVSGQSVVQNVPLKNLSQPSGGAGGGGGSGPFGTPLGLAEVAGASVLLIAIAVLVVWGLRRRPRSDPSNEAEGTVAPKGGA